MLSGGVESEGTRVGLASAWADWHIDSSPPLPTAAEHARDPLPTPDHLDHALVRLARPFGREPIAPGGPARGWVRVPATAPTLTEKMPVMILQHPKSLPIKLAFDTEAVLAVNANRTRVRYATNTEDGSSGSPCFNATWGLIAAPLRGAERQAGHLQPGCADRRDPAQADPDRPRRRPGGRVAMTAFLSIGERAS